MPVGNLSAVQRLLDSPLLAAAVAVVGTWTGPTTLSLSFTFGTPASVRDWAAVNVGRVTVTVQPAASLTSANGESGASNASALVAEGSWGDEPVLTVAEQNATAVTVTLGPPTTAVGYSTQVRDSCSL